MALRDLAQSRCRPRPMPDRPWAQQELQLTRRFVGRDLVANKFIRDLLHARNESIDAGEFKSADFEGLLNDIWFAVDTHNEYDDLREPDEFDDAQLLDVLTRYLADWDADTWEPDPRWAG
jgi:hypothetical protein